jgi:excisionase family DNA binding protein
VVGEDWLTVSDVADQLKVSVIAVQGWIRRGELRALRLGGKAGYRIRPSDLANFIEQRTEGGAEARTDLAPAGAASTG